MAEHVINNAWPSAQGRGGTVVPSICVFDVNETLIDIEFIAPLFERLFGDQASDERHEFESSFCVRKRLQQRQLIPLRFPSRSSVYLVWMSGATTEGCQALAAEP